MITLGLTGSIAMGKSAASAMLQKMGCGVHDADKVVYEALSSSGEGFEEVALTFPAAWDKKKHIIKRDVLADIIFKNLKQKEVLEEILHPIVRKSQIKFIQSQKSLGRKIVVLDIPLLFETGAESYVDYTVVVSAPSHLQRIRALKRPNMSAEKFKKILDSQMSDQEKCARADFIISTAMGMAYTYRSLENMLGQVSKEFTGR